MKNRLFLQLFFILWLPVTLCDLFHSPKNIKIYHRIEKNPTKRVSSYPYISGDTFRSICDHVFDETSIGLDTDQVKTADTLFIIPQYLSFFFEHIYPKILVPIILVSHNSDDSVPGIYKGYLDDDKIVAWFSTNTDIEHPKLFPIPIGLANRYWPHGNIEVIEREMMQDMQKDILLYLNLPAITHSSRSKLIQLFKNRSYCYASKQKPYKQYLGDMARSKFVLSPRGGGIDCHRTWEAILLGAVPIVPRTTINGLYDNLPVLIVDDWRDITQEFLELKWIEFKSHQYSLNRIMAQYWIDLIQEKKLAYRAKKAI